MVLQFIGYLKIPLNLNKKNIKNFITFIIKDKDKWNVKFVLKSLTGRIEKKLIVLIAIQKYVGPVLKNTLRIPWKMHIVWHVKHHGEEIF